MRGGTPARGHRGPDGRPAGAPAPAAFRWSNKLVGAEDPDMGEGPEAGAAIQMEMFQYADQLGARGNAPARSTTSSPSSSNRTATATS
ncbi:hypothetical protein ACU686_45305 [Yinghuangia aomiensis]